MSSFNLHSLLIATKSLVAWQGRASGTVDLEPIAGVVSVLAKEVPLVNASLGLF